MDNIPTATFVNQHLLWQHYQLHSDPFAKGPEQTYFPIAEWEKHLSLFQHLLHYSNVIIHITGPAGSGKTTLLQQFVQQTDNSFISTHTVNLPQHVSTEKLPHILHHAFDLAISHHTDYKATLAQQLVDIQQHTPLCVLIFDDAQQLSDETLLTLLTLSQQQDKHHARLHIMLFADHTLQARLERAMQQQALSDAVYTVTLAPLTQQQTKQYLSHRLHAVGLVGNIPLLDSHILRIWHASQGNIAAINHHGKLALLEQIHQPSTGTQAKHAKPRAPRRLFLSTLWHTQKKRLGIVILFALAFSGVSWLSQQLQKNHAPNSVPPMVNPVRTPPPPAILRKNSDPQLGVAERLERLHQLMTPAYRTPASNEAGPIPLSVPVHSATTLPTVPWAKQTTAPSDHTPQQQKLAAKPTPPATAATITSTQAIAQETPPTATAKKPAVIQYSDDEKFLLAQKGSQYSLQIAAATSYKQLRKEHLALFNKRKYPTYVFRHGDKWHMLTYGVYPSFDEAKAAFKTIPRKLRLNSKPWPRRLQLIQQEIRRERNP